MPQKSTLYFSISGAIAGTIQHDSLWVCLISLALSAYWFACGCVALYGEWK